MVSKKVTYIDFNGNERTEELLFNISKAELMEMELSTTGGMTGMIERVIAAKDQPTIFKIFKDFILKAYGEKSPDGKRFIKSDELSTAFSQTGAYEELMVELLSSDEAAAEFINSFIPKDVPNAPPANRPALASGT